MRGYNAPCAAAAAYVNVYPQSNHPSIGLKQGRSRGQARGHSCFSETNLLMWLLAAMVAVNLHDIFILYLPLLANYSLKY